MQFSSFSEFIDMGGYGFFVWLSFGAAALLLILLTISSKAGHQKVLNQIAQKKAREDKLRASRAKREESKTTQSNIA